MKSRREFLRNCVAFAGFAAAFFHSLKADAKKLALKLSQVPQLQKVGSAVIIKLEGEEIMLIREKQNSVKAVSPTCTHKYCDVSYNPTRRVLDCHCHASSFSLDGKVLGGPATRALKTFQAKIDGDRILVRL